ncbi:hypothetical protein [Acinetobacter equi]|uniref:Flavoprotein n=1 Tax=Acinetobacter equi TaxID=1324350 RepID=A0A0N9W579_9GAMM|nr:hypothetical protein [Acinetobacter equi]ALH96392.1 hypothetical protein AOY20_13060 [Acinetobacter equi]
MIEPTNVTLEKHPFFHKSISFDFHGKIIQSKEIESQNFSAKNVAIIGTDQNTVTHLNSICNSAESVVVFQIKPKYILPKTDKLFQKFIHPLFTRNKRFLNQRIKSITSLRFLENKVINDWLRKQLSPNIANIPKKFLRSDDYYTALQSKNCRLITWPIKKVVKKQLTCMDNSSYPADIIILSEHEID